MRQLNMRELLAAPLLILSIVPMTSVALAQQHNHVSDKQLMQKLRGAPRRTSSTMRRS
jgi:hypothetical protein